MAAHSFPGSVAVRGLFSEPTRRFGKRNEYEPFGRNVMDRSASNFYTLYLEMRWGGVAIHGYAA
ncbi:MAG: hypothetical protein AB8G99_22075 [Planctomycetaceae bacterium]